MRIGGVASEDNMSDILTKNLQPHLHQKHCTPLNIKQNIQKKHTKLRLTNNTLQQSTTNLTRSSKSADDSAAPSAHANAGDKAEPGADNCATATSVDSDAKPDDKARGAWGR